MLREVKSDREEVIDGLRNKVRVVVLLVAPGYWSDWHYWLELSMYCMSNVTLTRVDQSLRQFPFTSIVMSSLSVLTGRRIPLGWSTQWRRVYVKPGEVEKPNWLVPRQVQEANWCLGGVSLSTTTNNVSKLWVRWSVPQIFRDISYFNRLNVIYRYQYAGPLATGKANRVQTSQLL